MQPRPCSLPIAATLLFCRKKFGEIARGRRRARDTATDATPDLCMMKCATSIFVVSPPPPIRSFRFLQKCSFSGYRLHERGNAFDRLPSHPAGRLNMRPTNAQSLCMPYGARQGSLRVVRVKLIILIRPILQNLEKEGDWRKCQKDGGGRDSSYRVTAPCMVGNRQAWKRG